MKTYWGDPKRNHFQRAKVVENHFDLIGNQRTVSSSYWRRQGLRDYDRPENSAPLIPSFRFFGAN